VRSLKHSESDSSAVPESQASTETTAKPDSDKATPEKKNKTES